MQTDMIKGTRALRERLLSDRYRPGYHFAVPDDMGMPGDPNGCFYENGRYHLMYLYENRKDSFRWGHISSIDLVHWRHHKDAIFPTEKLGGCFSGGAFLDDDGTAYISYWRLPPKGGDVTQSGIAIAKSVGPDYSEWEMIEKLAIACTEDGITEVKGADGTTTMVGCADPSNIWKKDGVYYMQTGNLLMLNKYGREEDSPFVMRGDWVDLFRSNDILNWEYVGRFYDRKQDNSWTVESEDDMCPSFLPLPKNKNGGEPSGKYLQLFISHNKGCQYYVGDYDKIADKFLPISYGRMTWEDNTYFAPEALIDGKGRQIMWAWLLDNNGEIENWLEDGWTGVFGLPRNLWLGENGILKMEPVEELKVLRYNEKEFGIIELIGDNKHELMELDSLSCELEIGARGDNGLLGLYVCADKDFKEYTHIYYDPLKQKLVFDGRKSGKLGRPILEEAPFVLEEGEELRLRVFIDKSVIEVYANERQAITRRVYTENPESTRIYLACNENGKAVYQVKAWDIFPSNPY